MEAQEKEDWHLVGMDIEEDMDITERLWSQRIGMSKNILSSMMDGRKDHRGRLPHISMGLRMLRRLLVEQVH